MVTLMKRHITFIALSTIVLIACFIITMRILAWHYDVGTLLKSYPQEMILYVQLHPIKGIIFFILSYIAIALAGLPFAPLLMVLSGYLFGIINGLVLSLCAAALASIVLIGIIRLGLENWAKSFLHPEHHAVLLYHLKKYGSLYVILMQLLPATPVWIMTVAVALIDMPIATWLLASTIGLIPGTLWYTIIGFQIRTSGFQLSSLYWIGASFIILTFITGLLGWYMYWLMRK